MPLKLNSFGLIAKCFIETLNMILDVDANCTIHPAAVVRDLGVLLDSQLLMSNHIAYVARAC